MHLTDEQRKKLIELGLAVLITIIAGVAGILGYQVIVPQNAGAAETRTARAETALAGPGNAGYQCGNASTPCLVSRYGRDLQVYSDAGATLVFQVDGSTGLVAHAGFDRLTAANSITVTNGNPITPTGTYQPIAAAGAVTPTLATAGFTAGQVLMLVNTSAQNILIQDTGNQVLAGNITLGQYDTLTLLFDGTRWIELRRSDN